MIQHHDINREIAAQRHREADAWASARSLRTVARSNGEHARGEAWDAVDIRSPRERLALMRRRARSLAIVGPTVGVPAFLMLTGLG